MPRIHVMSDNLANKIAAGEVVERSSSVVKELVENAIDAGSSIITIDLINGGLNGITITDNGCGMEHDDALLSFQRHATSKLIREDDLFLISTLGFRGEALPSIASVSEVDLVTCAKTIGTHLHIKGGKLEIDEAADKRVGTRINIKNLFYNTPARLKYLKSEPTELASCVSYIEKIALSYPQIKFTLTNNERAVVKTSGSGNLKKTIHEIYGLQVSSKLIEIKNSNDDYDIRGFICKPEILKSNRYHMTTIVNGRVIRNNDLNHAINDAYYTYKPDSKYPIVIINIETDPTLIDVNIHPTKQDIKFSKQEELYNLLNKTIKEALYKNLLLPSAMERLKATNDIISKEEINSIIEDKINMEDNETKEDASLDYEVKESKQGEFNFGVAEDTVSYEQEEKQDDEDEPSTSKNKIKSLNLHPIGAINLTFIVAQGDDGLYLIDQHAAHERINYEKVLKYFQEEKIVTTPLLVPMPIELTPTEFILVQKNLDLLKSMGFVLEEFGLNTFVFKEHPIWFKEGFEEEGLRRVIDMIIQSGANFDVMKFRDRAAAMLACKMSIKANMSISLEVMQHLLDDLALCDNPYNCAHGRPTIINFSSYDLNRMFKRIMN